MTVNSQRRRAIVPVLLWSALVGYCALIFFASSRPVPEELHLDIPGLDKVVHAGAYGVWAAIFLGALAATGRSWSYGRLAWLTLLATALYGVSDEVHQSFVPGRTADILDWFADVGGAVLLVLAVAWWRRKLRQCGE